MAEPSLGELIQEREEKAAECLLLAQTHEAQGARDHASAWKMSADYAMATVNYLRELRDIKDRMRKLRGEPQ